MRRRARNIAVAAALIAWPLIATADDAKVLDVRVAAQAGGTFRFDVTVGHADEGWKHYADKFEVLAPDGTVLGTRVLLHPHQYEQPFTRSLRGVKVPPGISEVTVRAWDKVHKAGTRTITVTLPTRR